MARTTKGTASCGVSDGTQVTLTFLHSSETEANGTYSYPGSHRSQCISSDITVTPFAAASSPTLASSSRVHILPEGFCGLHSIIKVHSGSESFFSRSSKSIS